MKGRTKSGALVATGVLVAGTVFGSSAPARGDQVADDIMVMRKQAQQHHDAKQYERELDLLDKIYEKRPLPWVLCYQGAAHEKLGQLQAALDKLRACRVARQNKPSEAAALDPGQPAFDPRATHDWRGQPAVERVTGMPVFELFARDTVASELEHRERAIVELTRTVDRFQNRAITLYDARSAHRRSPRRGREADPAG